MPRPGKRPSRPPTTRRHASAQTASARPPAADLADAQARLPELLALPPEADPLGEVARVAAEAPGGLPALIAALGASREAGAGRILQALAIGAGDKEHRKAARRALHQLQGAGLAVAVPVAAPADAAVPAIPAGETLQPARAVVSAIDGVGSRMLWLLLDRPHGGSVMFTVVLNDIVGAKDAIVEDTTHRRFGRRIDEWEELTDLSRAEIPTDYGLALIAEALALNATSGFPLPRELVIHRSRLGTLPPPPAAALIHQHVSRGQTFLLPDLLDRSEELLDEPELQSWLFSYGEVERAAREYRQAGESRLILTAESPEAHQQRIVDTAVDALFTPAVRRGYRRRLEETAYILWEDGRRQAARQAVAAAFAIGDTGSLRSHPLTRAIVLRSIELAADVMRSGTPIPHGANRTAWTPV